MNARIAAVAGLIFAIFTFLSVTAADPLRQAGDAALLDWWSDDGNRQSLYISMYFRLLAVPFLLAFLVQVRTRLRAAEGPDGWADLVYSLGIVAAIGFAISGVGRGVLAQSVSLRDEPLPGVDVLRFVTEDSLGVYSLVSMPALALAVGLFSLVSLRSKVFATWIAWLGIPVAALSLAMVALQAGALATPLLLIWTLVVCLELWRSASDTSTELKFIDVREAASK